MKKLIRGFAGSLLSLCVLFSGFMFVACSRAESVEKTISKVTDIYGFASMTSVIFMEKAKANLSSQSVLPDKVEQNIVVDTIDRYIDVFDSFIGEKTPVTTIKAISDKNDYETKLIVSVTNVTGKTINYYIYYNEYAITDTNKENVIKDSNAEEYKVKTTIAGIVIYGDGEEQDAVIINGIKEIKDDEVEFSLSVSNGTKQVVFAMESEFGEQTFTYGLYNQSGLVEEFSYEIEEKNNCLKVDFKIKIIDVDYSFEIYQKMVNEARFLEIKYNDGGGLNKIDVIIKNEGGELVYTYNLIEGSTINKTR